MKMWLAINICGMCFGVSTQSKAWTTTDTLLLNRIYHYADSSYARPIDTTYYSYTRYTIGIHRKNILLMAVPNLFDMARSGKRHFMGETPKRWLRTPRFLTAKTSCHQLLCTYRPRFTT